MPKKSPAATRAAMPDPLAAPAQPPAQALLPTEVAPAANDEARRSIEVINTQLAEFDKVEVGLKDLETKYAKVVYPVSTTQGMEDAKAARKAIQTPRFALETARKAAKRPVIDIGRQIDGRAAKIEARLLAIETPISEQITAQETAEANRKQELQRRLTEIRNTPSQSIGKSIDELMQIADGLATLDLASFQEFREDAAALQMDAQRQVSHLLTTAREAEAGRKALEAQRIDQERKDAIRARIADILMHVGTAAMARTSASVQRVLDQVNAIDIGEDYAEFRDEARGVRQSVLGQLIALRDTKKQAEDAAAEAATLREQAVTVVPTAAPRVIVAESVGSGPRAEPAAPARLVSETFAGSGIPEDPFETVSVAVFAAQHVGTNPAGELGYMPERPSDDEIVDHLCDHFEDHGLNVIEWLAAMDLQAQRARFGQPALPLAA